METKKPEILDACRESGQHSCSFSHGKENPVSTATILPFENRDISTKSDALRILLEHADTLNWD